MFNGNFQLARVAALPGVKTTMTLDPRLIPARTRKMAARMIADGITVGGWQSKSVKIARIIAEHFGIALSNTHPRSYYLTIPKNDAVREQVVRIHEVDTVQYLLQDHKDRYFNRNAFTANRKSEVEMLLEGRNNYLHFRCKSRLAEATEVVTSFYRAQTATDTRYKQAVDLLMGDSPITLSCIPSNI
jgi:hypothetical protein